MSDTGHAKELSQSARLLLATHTSYLPIAVGFKIFVSSFLLTATADIAGLGVFRLAFFVSLWATFLITARYCKESGILPFYQLSFILTLLFFLLLMSLGHHARDYLLLTGMTAGVAAGLYWMPYHIYKMALSGRSSRLTFFATENIITQITGVIVPIVFGWLIWRMTSYVGFFVLCAALSVAGIFFSTKIERLRT